MTRKWLVVCGVVAPVLDVLITVWLGALDPDYSHVRQYTSELGEAGRPYAAVFSSWCILWGLLFAGFAVALGHGLGGQKGSWLGPGALLVVAASSIAVGFFPCDPGGTARTLTGQLHLLLGGWIGMSAIVLTPFLSWAGMRRSEAWRGYRTLTLATGALLAAAAGWSAVCYFADLERATCAAGPAQRLFMGMFYVWVEVVAVRLWSVRAAAKPP